MEAKNNMTAEQFVYWLQGYMELSDSKLMSSRQVEVVKDHLALVFNKVTPDRQLLNEASTIQDPLVWKSNPLPGTYISTPDFPYQPDSNQQLCSSVGPYTDNTVFC